MTRKSMAAMIGAVEKLHNVIENWKEEEDAILKEIAKKQKEMDFLYEKLDAIGDGYANRLDKEIPGWREILLSKKGAG